MKTENLINALVNHAKPVKRLSSPPVRFLRWLIAVMFCLGAGILLFGLRPDLHSVAFAPSFSFQALFVFGLALLSALSAFLLSVPDKKNLWLDTLPIVTGVALAGTLLWGIFGSDSTHAGLGFTCIRDIVVLGLLPGALLFFMLMQAAPLRLGKVGFFAMLSVGALGAFGTQFICKNDDPLHILLWHYLPVLVLGAVGIMLGNIFLRWEKS